MTTTAPARASARSASTTRCRFVASRSLVGSSASTTAGAAASVRASATRCCWPPDSSSTRWLPESSRPSSASAARVRSRAWVAGTPAASSGISTFSSAVRNDGSPLPCGVSAMPRPAASIRSSTGVPPTSTVPAWAVAPASAHSSDDLPAPDGPVTASIPPGGTANVAGCTATSWPYRTSTPSARSGPGALTATRPPPPRAGSPPAPRGPAPACPAAGWAARGPAAAGTRPRSPRRTPPRAGPRRRSCRRGW